jgi:hypothetical protein
MKNEKKSNNDKKENISFFLNEIEIESNNDITLEDLIHKVDQAETPTHKINHHINNDMIPYFVDYQINYTIKQLLMICDYYDISKICKMNKCNKEEIIHHLMVFENDLENIEIVLQRKNLWFYLNELKKDKFTKKFVLW